MTPEMAHARIVRAAVKFRLKDCRRRLLIDAEQEAAAEAAITARLLQGVLADPQADPSSDFALAMIEEEVQAEIVPERHFVMLAALRHAGHYVLGDTMMVKVVYTTADRSEMSSVLPTRALHQAFPFTTVSAHAYGVNPCVSCVSPEGLSLLRSYVSARPAPAALYEVSDGFRPSGAGWVSGPVELPEGWGLDDTTPLR